MAKNKLSAQKRGRAFEDAVAEILEELRVAHPDKIQVVRYPSLRLHNAVEVIPDFELTYCLPFQVSRLLIECQDRTRGSQDILRKISYMKCHSPHNRVIFLYKDPSLLSESLIAALESDGVLHYSLPEFAAMLFGLSSTLEAAESMLVLSAPAGQAKEDPADHKSMTVCFDASGSMAGKLKVILAFFRRILSADEFEAQRLWLIIDDVEPRKFVFLPRSVGFLQRIFRASRKKRCLGSGFTDEVVVEIFKASRKEETGNEALVAILLSLLCRIVDQRRMLLRK